MDGRKIDKLSPSRPKKADGASGEPKLAGLELAELLLESVDIAAGQIVGLLDDPVPLEAPAKRAHLPRPAVPPRSRRALRSVRSG